MLIREEATDFKPIIAAFQGGEPVTVRFAFPTRSTLRTINSMIAQLLSGRDRVFLLESLITIIRECVYNAVKANAKRLYFEKEGGDITDKARYESLIRDFKDKVIMNFNEMQSDLEMSVYRADFTITPNTEGFAISVINNVPLMPTEKTRIDDRINAAGKYTDFNEVYEEMYDDTEGAGLGIILTILILKNCGVKNSFSITSDGTKTVTTFKIPDLLRPQELSTNVKIQITDQISVLPTFPTTTIELLDMCDHPKSTLTKLGERIATDPSLTADILKLANSAGFFSSRKIDTISDALVRIGLKNLKYMLIAASSRTILEKRFKKFETIWAHCLKTAFYAHELSLMLGLRGIEDQAFICGLLHDMGKIVLLSVDLDITNRIAEIVEQHRIRTTTVIEEISIGISHSMIGKLIADKWNFSDFLIEGIEYHHSPHQSKPEYRNIVYVTYLANLLCGVETKKYEHLYADTLVIESLGINDEAALAAIHQKLITQYDAQNKNDR
jgi:HD-like signal output (HDOD) protein